MDLGQDHLKYMHPMSADRGREVTGEVIDGPQSVVFDEAENYILFQFFIVHDDEIGRRVKDHLIARAKDGVRVYFLYDEVGSKDLPKAYKQELAEAGVEVYRYQDGFLHQKVMLIDDAYAIVGTTNFDNRSFRLNFEITAAVADSDFASEIEGMLENDFSRSRLMAPGEFDAKPWWFRFGVKLARLTAPVQ